MLPIDTINVMRGGRVTASFSMGSQGSVPHITVTRYLTPNKLVWFSRAIMPTAQPDLFSALGDDSADPPGSRQPSRYGHTVRRASSQASWPDPEAAVALLHNHPDYRVLKRLQPRPITVPRPLRDGERLAVIVYTETTGLDQDRDEVIEIGMVLFIHDQHGIRDIMATLGGLQEPSIAISVETTRLTGITAEMVQGQRLDIDAIERFIAPADLVIAHNARFDRPFCERLARGFDVKAWACSNHEVRWADFASSVPPGQAGRDPDGSIAHALGIARPDETFALPASSSTRFA